MFSERKEFYAHSLPGRPPSKWHKLEDHLKAVAALARKFADLLARPQHLGAGWSCIASATREPFGGRSRNI